MIVNDKQRKEFEELTKPVVKFLSNNFHPHIKIIITPVNAELLEGIVNFSTKEYLKD